MTPAVKRARRSTIDTATRKDDDTVFVESLEALLRQRFGWMDDLVSPFARRKPDHVEDPTRH